MMAKVKTHNGLAKRVKITGRGKVKRQMAFAGHLMSGKPGERRQRLRQTKIQEGKLARNIKRALNAE
jgi:large subunit ribosomal protein L35